MIKDILANLNSDFAAVKKTLTTKKERTVKVEDSLKQYNVKDHNVLTDTLNRPDKKIKKMVNGQEQESTIKVARLPVNFQELIVSRAASFLLGEGVQIKDYSENDNHKAIVEMIKAIWKDCKLDYKNRQIARTLFSEMEVAELWYFVEDSTIWQRLLNKLGLGDVKFKIRLKVLSKSLGYDLYPHYDEFGDMDAFSVAYVIDDGTNKINHFDIYTAETIYKYAEVAGAWVPDPNTKAPVAKNPIGKIPVIYYEQDKPDWYNVQALIERYETLISNFADTNDYFGSPQIVLSGKVNGLADKGDSGKVIQLENGASANYLTWDQAPESVKLELETLMNLIFSNTQTPDISFSQMKNIGNISGIALKMMFLDAQLKALSKTEIFGECIQRRLNLLKSAICNVIQVKYQVDGLSLELEPIFNFYLPSNETELIDNLVAATGNKQIMSRKTAVSYNPFVDNTEQELLDIDAETKAENDAAGSFNLE